jgi:hypothetical protein
VATGVVKDIKYQNITPISGYIVQVGKSPVQYQLDLIKNMSITDILLRIKT